MSTPRQSARQRAVAHSDAFLRDGVRASRLQLAPGPWATLLGGVCDRFPAIDRACWQQRFERGLVMDAHGVPLHASTPYRAGMEVRYFREVADEPRIPLEESVRHLDEHLLVVDKPPFLPVMPGGGFVTETLLARLLRTLGDVDLAPLHRLDRATSGLVLFSVNPASRDAYAALFRERRIHKDYEALAAPMAAMDCSGQRCSRLVGGEPFFRMQEVAGEPNSETRIEVIEKTGSIWRYRLNPVTGRKHQLRVHMAALGAPILNDPFYPLLRPEGEDDYQHPLKLLARELAFVDPLTGEARRFTSGLSLDAA